MHILVLLTYQTLVYRQQFLFVGNGHLSMTFGGVALAATINVPTYYYNTLSTWQ